jgi:hypothetical protein
MRLFAAATAPAPCMGWAFCPSLFIFSFLAYYLVASEVWFYLQFLDPSNVNQYTVWSLTMGFDCLLFSACKFLVVFIFSL